MDEIRQADAGQHADYGEMVDIETESRIPIWRTFVFQKPEVVISQPLIEICRRNLVR